MLYIINYIKNILSSKHKSFDTRRIKIIISRVNQRGLVSSELFPDHLDQIFCRHPHHHYPRTIACNCGWKTLSCFYRLHRSIVRRTSHKNTYPLVKIIHPPRPLLTCSAKSHSWIRCRDLACRRYITENKVVPCNVTQCIVMISHFYCL